MSAELNQAVAWIKGGQKLEAQRLLQSILQTDPKNEIAWMWYVETLPDIRSQVHGLEQCLRLNPDSKLAQQGLARLKASLAPEPEMELPSFLQADAPAAPKPALPPQDTPPAPPNRPAPPRASQPAQVPPHGQQTPAPTKAKKSKWLWLILLAVLFLLAICAGIVLLGGSYFRSLTSSSSVSVPEVFSEIEATVQGAVSPSGELPIGIYVLKNGQPVMLERGTGTPASAPGTPSIQDHQPTFLLNLTGSNPQWMTFNPVEGNDIGPSVNLDLTMDSNGFRAVPREPLQDGVYCFVHSTADTPPGMADMWCVVVGDPAFGMLGGFDPNSISVAPPGDGYYLYVQGDLIPLAKAAEKLAGDSRAGLPVTTDSQPILVVQSSEFQPDRAELVARVFSTGIRITNGGEMIIADNSSAAQAGLNSGDRLFSVNGQEITGRVDQLQDEMDLLLGEEGSEVSIVAQQGTKTIELTLQRTQRANYSFFKPQSYPKEGYVILRAEKGLQPNLYCLNDYYCFVVE